ncbi:uncharacterized protein ARMOST_02400 [Armillaria ostoyae]|uniref:Uncharacterized protein n=1 Tax=Armillaria ostoyae TaxID=47428 RepID=A0A284QRJ9_ARMOS|nr:uncharacterized protein ARMOST_02400 [Armillaria ostoyae]
MRPIYTSMRNTLQRLFLRPCFARCKTKRTEKGVTKSKPFKVSFYTRLEANRRSDCARELPYILSLSQQLSLLLSIAQAMGVSMDILQGKGALFHSCFLEIRDYL